MKPGPDSEPIDVGSAKPTGTDIDKPYELGYELQEPEPPRVHIQFNESGLIGDAVNEFSNIAHVLEIILKNPTLMDDRALEMILTPKNHYGKRLQRVEYEMTHPTRIVDDPMATRHQNEQIKAYTGFKNRVEEEAAKIPHSVKSIEEFDTAADEYNDAIDEYKQTKDPSEQRQALGKMKAAADRATRLFSK